MFSYIRKVKNRLLIRKYLKGKITYLEFRRANSLLKKK